MDSVSARFRLSEIFEQRPEILMPEAGTSLVVYGAGNCGRDVLRVLQDAGYEVVAFLDTRAAADSMVGGIPSHRLESPEASRLATAGLPVLIAVYNFTADTGMIALRLREAGFHSVLPYYALEAKFPGTLKSRYWLETREYWAERREAIFQGLDLWVDEESRGIYLALMELRLTGNLQLLRNPDRAHQYFPADLPALKEPVRMIDGGAYVGDTLAAMERYELEAVAAFEPDQENFQALKIWVEQAVGLPKETVLFPCGLGSQTGWQSFHSSQQAGSAMGDAGETAIQVLALDDVLPRFQPTFIKLDIEGAETAALNGAAQTITSSQPRLAICVYHRPDDLWNVPLLMRQLVPGHRLFLRYHGFNGFDAVAYAIEP